MTSDAASDPTSPGSTADGPGARLCRVTTFQLGGPCRNLRTCAEPGDLLLALRDLAPSGDSPVILGGGSNLLISDEGLDSVVIRYRSDQLTIRRTGDEVETDGSAPLAALAEWAVEEGLSGLEFATGIPGTVGGGIAGNAGAFGRQLADILKTLQVADTAGQLREADPSEFQFSYRDSTLKVRGLIVVTARFRLKPGDRGALRAERDRIRSSDAIGIRTGGSRRRRAVSSGISSPVLRRSDVRPPAGFSTRSARAPFRWAAPGFLKNTRTSS
ncbi:MAG: FAD-binding protein [Kiritimatiellia bacterium]|nr:FAD-binding protein [Kiritimatiellia bacterium]